MASHRRRCRWRGDTGSARTCSPNGTLARHTRRRHCRRTPRNRRARRCRIRRWSSRWWCWWSWSDTPTCGTRETEQVDGVDVRLRVLGRRQDPQRLAPGLLAFLGFAYLHHDVLLVTAHLLAQLARVQPSRESKLRRRRLELGQPGGRRRTAGDGVLIIDAEPDLERAGVVAHVVLVAGIAVHTLNLGGRRAGHAGDIELRIAIRLGPVPPGDERKRPRADAERHGGRQEADEQAKSRATDTLRCHGGLLSPTNRPAGR